MDTLFLVIIVIAWLVDAAEGQTVVLSLMIWLATADVIARLRGSR